MITDKQYRDLVERVNQLEDKVNKLSRALAEMSMKGKPTQQKEIVAEETAKKDVTKYKFNGNICSKRSIVLEVVQAYVAENKVDDAAELRDVFPDYIQGPLGVIRKAEDAERYEGSDKRYYFEDENILMLNGEPYVICKDWTSKNIKNFLDVAETLGYEIQTIYR